MPRVPELAHACPGQDGFRSRGSGQAVAAGGREAGVSTLSGGLEVDLCPPRPCWGGRAPLASGPHLPEWQNVVSWGTVHHEHVGTVNGVRGRASPHKPSRLWSGSCQMGPALGVPLDSRRGHGRRRGGTSCAVAEAPQPAWGSGPALPRRRGEPGEQNERLRLPCPCLEVHAPPSCFSALKQQLQRGFPSRAWSPSCFTRSRPGSP